MLLLECAGPAVRLDGGSTHVRENIRHSSPGLHPRGAHLHLVRDGREDGEGEAAGARGTGLPPERAKGRGFSRGGEGRASEGDRRAPCTRGRSGGSGRTATDGGGS